MDGYLSEILARMEEAVAVSEDNEEKGHAAADDLLVDAARHCGVPEEILAAYKKVEKWYA